MPVQDIRDRLRLDHQDIVQLNFIRSPNRRVFRRHFRTGLRSLLMEVLRPEDIEAERRGVCEGGIRRFPRAVPIKMLRIFRVRLDSLAQAEAEMRTVKAAARWLAPDHMAVSEEFLVSYRSGASHAILLCGLQEYVAGAVLDPWRPMDLPHLAATAAELGAAGEPAAWRRRLREQAASFSARVRKLILEEHLVPDLAGVGNLFATAAGDVKLIDINNISRVFFDRRIRLDDRGYPVCDKSIEALCLIEQKLLGRSPDPADPLRRVFLDDRRRQAVQRIETAFGEGGVDC